MTTLTMQSQIASSQVVPAVLTMFDEAVIPQKKSVLTLGGCNLFEALSPFEDILTRKHFWRSSITSIASDRLKFRSLYFGSKAVNDFVMREVTKVIYSEVQTSEADLVIFEAASDFAVHHLRIRDTIIPDFRNNLFGPDFDQSVFENTDLENAEILSVDSIYYWDVWKSLFDRMYKNMLLSKINSGMKVAFLSRRFCLTKLSEGRLQPFEIADLLIKRNAILDDIEKFLEGYEGISILRMSEQLLYSSDDAPFGGPWEFHPERGYYVSLRRKILDLLFPGGGGVRDVFELILGRD